MEDSMNHRILLGSFAVASALAAVALVVGCNQEKNGATEAAGPDPAGQKLLLAEEPAGAKGVLDVRKTAKDGDEIVIVGRIGGDKNPWIEGKAAFLIVEPSFKTCSEREGDNCPTPWDYCCDPPDELAKGLATIKFVDEQGKTIGADARKLLGLRELNTVVVKGKAKRDRDGNLIVLATGLYRRADQKK
jgi:hypothetical protein